MGLRIAILHISGRIIMATLVHCIIGLSLICGLACIGLWSNTSRDQMWPPGHHFNHLFSQSQVNKPLVRVFNVFFPEDIYSPERDRRGPNLTLEYLVRILLGSPALRLSLSQKFVELSYLDCLTFFLYCY